MADVQLALHALAAGLAWLLWRRVPSAGQRRLSGALWLLVALDVTRRAMLPGDLAERAAAWQRGEVPALYTGGRRLAWAVGKVATGGWYAAWGAAVWGVLKSESPDVPGRGFRADHERLRRRAPIILALASLASLSLFALYPWARGRPVELALVAVFDASLALQIVAVAAFLRRRVAPTDAQRAALVLAASTLASFVGAWWAGHPSRDWSNAAWPSVVTWLILAGWEARCLLKPSK